MNQMARFPTLVRFDSSLGNTFESVSHTNKNAAEKEIHFPRSDLNSESLPSWSQTLTNLFFPHYSSTVSASKYEINTNFCSLRSLCSFKPSEL